MLDSKQTHCNYRRETTRDVTTGPGVLVPSPLRSQGGRGTGGGVVVTRRVGS